MPVNRGIPRLGVDQAIARALAVAGSVTGKRLVDSTLWAVVSEVLSRGLLFLGMIAVARLLSTDAYGEFGLVRSTITVFATVGGMGLGLTANRFVAQHRASNARLAGHIIGASLSLALLSGVLVGGTVTLAAESIATALLHAPGIANSLRLAGFMLVLSAVSGAQMGILQGLEAYRQIAFGSLGQGLVAIAALVFGTRYFGLPGALMGLLAYSITGVVVLHVQVTSALRRAGITAFYGNLRETLPIFWSFSLPVMLAGVAIAPLKWLAEILLARTVGFSELGVFTAAMTMVAMLSAVVSTLNAPLLSLAAAHVAQTSKRIDYASYYGSWYASLALLSPVVVFPRVVSLVFGPQFNNQSFHRVVVLMALYVALMMYYQGVARQLALRGSMWFGLGTNLVEGATLMAAFVAFGSYGAVGLAAAYVMSYVVRIAVTLPILVRRGLVRRELLLDRAFTVSGISLLAVVCLQLAALR